MFVCIQLNLDESRLSIGLPKDLKVSGRRKLNYCQFRRLDLARLGSNTTKVALAGTCCKSKSQADQRDHPPRWKLGRNVRNHRTQIVDVLLAHSRPQAPHGCKLVPNVSSRNIARRIYRNDAIVCQGFGVSEVADTSFVGNNAIAKTG